ncbi:oxygenase MpaB family protein [Pseudomonas sp. NPDC089918]|uniref:oxygenase MpaB family protein n=1 Tax=Pseudomonas sp. NPDC089918 TaxID=3390654 RepID=UPI003D08C291
MQNSQLLNGGGVLNRDRAIDRFGKDRVLLIERMLNVADPVSDAAVAALHMNSGFSRADLNRGIANGLASLADAPDAIQCLLRESETIPDWIDASKFRAGSDTYLAVGEPWIGLALGLGGLLHTYTSPSIAKVLIATDNLSQNTERRMLETSLWRNSAVSRGGLNIGADGYVSTIQVRVLHSNVRFGLLRKGWDAEKVGQPINQVEMLRTWLSTIAIPMLALPKVGIDFSTDEVAVLFNMYHYIAHLIGVSPELYRLVDGLQSAKEMLDLIDMTCGLVSDDSRKLTHASLEVVAKTVAASMSLPASVAKDLVNELCLAFHGAELTEMLGIEKTQLGSLIPVFADANRYRRALVSSDKKLLEMQVIKTLDVHRARRETLAGKADYQ